MKESAINPIRLEKYERLLQLRMMLNHLESRFLAQYLAKDGLHVIHFPMIEMLLQEQMLSMKQLAERFGLPPATATALTDKLVQQGFVDRVHDTRDRRVVQITLTDKGKSYIEGMKHEWVQECSDGALNQFSGAELDTVADVASRLCTWYEQQLKEKM